MDALALLCNLYADGPSSRQQLVDAGLETLASVEGASSERISEILGASPRRGDRLRREAQVLRKRLNAGDLDREESHAPPSEAKADEPMPTAVERALAAWRRLDAEVASSGGVDPEPSFGHGVLEGAGQPPNTARGSAGAASSSREDRAPAPPEATPVLEVAGTPIPLNTLPLLDVEARGRLHAKGCLDLETLADWDPIDVAEVIDAPLTRCIHLRFAVRKFLGGARSTRVAGANGEAGFAGAETSPGIPGSPEKDSWNPDPRSGDSNSRARDGGGQGDELGADVVLRPVLGDIEPGSGGPFAD